MNENLNLCEILKDCPKGTKFWSPIWGDVVLKEITEGSSMPIKLTSVCSYRIALYPNGKMYDLEEAECVLFPSKDQRDWSKFKRPHKRFNPKDFKPFDKVEFDNLVVSLFDGSTNDDPDQDVLYFSASGISKATADNKVQTTAKPAEAKAK